MKLKFKLQPFQTAAVESVVDCFAGHHAAKVSYRIAHDRSEQMTIFDTYFKNAELELSDLQLLGNIRQVQQRQGLPLSEALVERRECKYNLDVEMETGTGKTYCYIKTIFELYKRYGWCKFIVMVPSIAIREGVYQSFQITAEHFAETYAHKVQFFIYNSKRLHQLNSFSSDAGINVMVINIQAFNARGADNRRIYESLDDFQSRRPIDIISCNRPILILDEPQKMEGRATVEALIQFKPLMILRYSATHKTTHNRVHRLDALDAYNQKLVKKIAVRGIQTRGLAGVAGYLYLESIEVSKKAPVARIDLELQSTSGTIKRVVKRLHQGCDLYAKSGGLEQYRGFTIAQIDANQNTVEFTNGVILSAGEAIGDVTEQAVRRIQIREAIKAHLNTEKQLHPSGIKVLSLFFIDTVAKYRDYNQGDQKGEYARLFESEYTLLRDQYLSEQARISDAYCQYLKQIEVKKTHNGYFSIDNKGKAIDSKSSGRGTDKQSNDVNAYDLILKDKQRLLSLEEPTRFLFSHSALREGWDNPNVFVMCMLKHSDNTISRRQEVGRGLRLCVNHYGDRMDDWATVHQINVLTVITSESYTDFVSHLQQEISATLDPRPRQATQSYFIGKTITAPTGPLEINEVMAHQIYRYLIKHDYIDDTDHINPTYRDAKETHSLAPLGATLAVHTTEILRLIDDLYSENLPLADDRRSRANRLNANFKKQEFQALWRRINRKAIYRVAFDSTELIQKCITALDEQLQISRPQYQIRSGVQNQQLSDEDLRQKGGFTATSTVEETGETTASLVKYDLLGKVAEGVQLTRQTLAAILSRIKTTVFDHFKYNPEQFIAKTIQIINEQKVTVIIEQLQYDATNDRYDCQIFTANQEKQDFTRAHRKLNKHIYDYVSTDSKVEQNLVEALELSEEVVVYAKLPHGFHIPTPVGNYNPDWAISFRQGNVKHIYFIAETKGSLSSFRLRPVEETKIKCARKFFAELNKKLDTDQVKYGAITDYEQMMNMLKSV